VKDYYKAYETAPVFAMCTNHDEFFYVEDYFQDLNPNTHMFTGEEEDEDEKFTREQQLTTSILNAVNWSKRQYDKVMANDVMPAFKKFDKDGSGEIDREELGELSAELGHTLTVEQINDALIDLDINGDGVIDLEEFKRWFFSGMKPFDGTKRSMLKFGAQFDNLMELLDKIKEVD
jgi:hypothetical protein